LAKQLHNAKKTSINDDADIFEKMKTLQKNWEDYKGFSN